jgi:hypothetical protein
MFAKLLGVSALAAATLALTIPSTAGAAGQYDGHGRDRYDRHERYDHNRGRHRAHKQRICRMEWRHHHRVRVCRVVYR